MSETFGSLDGKNTRPIVAANRAYTPTSNHSSVLPMSAATGSRHRGVCVWRLLESAIEAGPSACDCMLFSRRSALAGTLSIAQVPENASHDLKPLCRNRGQQMFIARVLVTAGMGVRNPDRRQLQHI